MVTAFAPLAGWLVAARVETRLRDAGALPQTEGVGWICTHCRRTKQRRRGPLGRSPQPTASHVAVSMLARAFANPRKALKDGLCGTDRGQKMHDRLRVFTACMTLAYHGVMHQCAGAGRSPCHGVLLEEQCRGCGAAAPYQLNARLLGSPFRCAECRWSYAGWRAKLAPQAAPPELRRAITRARFDG